MRRRTIRKSITPTQNLDSFLDILTNTVGVLMFIGLFVALISLEAGTIVKTPLVTNSNKTPHLFEVRKDRVIYIDTQEINRQLNTFSASLPTCEKPTPPEYSYSNYEYYFGQLQEYQNCLINQVDRFKTFEGKTDNYSVFIQEDYLIYQPIAKDVGEAPKQFTQADSKYNQILATLNPKNDYLAFIVRPDSFKAFRQAREQADKKGFDVGWEPQKSEIPLIFGSGGRTIGVQ